MAVTSTSAGVAVSSGGKKGRRARPAARALLAAAILASGCAASVRGLWPPPAGAAGSPPAGPTHRITVTVDAWHSVIGLWPPDDPKGEDPARLEEWAYAEKEYYMNGDKGSSGTTRAILWPSAGVVLVTHGDRPYSERSVQPPVRTWSFEVTDEGYRRLLEHLRAERASETPLRQDAAGTWYEARHSYCAGHQCHHFTARALRAAGLPVWSFYAFFKWSLEAQLDRAARIAAEPRQ